MNLGKLKLTKIKPPALKQEGLVLAAGYFVLFLFLAVVVWTLVFFYVYVVKGRRIEVSVSETPLLSEQEIDGAIKILDGRQAKLEEVLEK